VQSYKNSRIASLNTQISHENTLRSTSVDVSFCYVANVMMTPSRFAKTSASNFLTAVCLTWRWTICSTVIFKANNLDLLLTDQAPSSASDYLSLICNRLLNRDIPSSHSEPRFRVDVHVKADDNLLLRNTCSRFYG